MTAPIPLATYPWPPTDRQVELLKQARADLDANVIFVEAVLGSPGRVLALGSRPPFLCRWAPVRPENVDNPDSIRAALEFVLNESEDDARPDGAWADAGWLSEVFGAPVLFSHYEDRDGMVRFSEHQLA